MRERTELDPNQVGAPNRTAAAKRAIAGLTAAVPHVNSPALRDGIGALAKAIFEKADLVEKYKTESAQTKAALRAVISGAAMLSTPPVSPPAPTRAKRSSIRR